MRYVSPSCKPPGTGFDLPPLPWADQVAARKLTSNPSLSARPSGSPGALSFTVAAGCAFHRERGVFLGIGRGCSSEVEHHVSNVRVGGSSPFARSNEITRVVHNLPHQPVRCRPWSLNRIRRKGTP